MPTLPDADTPGILVRPELAPDHAAVAAVNEAAFGQPDEARLVDRLRGDLASSISLVAEADGRVIGVRGHVKRYTGSSSSEHDP